MKLAGTNSLNEAVIVEALRTPIGRAHKGGLADVRPDDLGAFIARSLLERVGNDIGAQVDELICGCGFPWGEQGYNVGRTIALLAGMPISTPGYTITRLCASSLQAIRAAHHAISLGEGGAYLVVGVESCTRAGRDRHLAENNPLLDPGAPGPTFADIYLSMLETAENVATLYGVSRKDMDSFALQSQKRALAGQTSGFFAREMVDFVAPDGSVMSQDDGPRSSTTMEILQNLPAVLPDKGGRVTAGNSCSLNDGAVAVLIMEAKHAASMGIRARARVVASGVAAVDPAIMGVGPIDAVKVALGRAGLGIDDMDVVEINEAFASQVVAVSRAIGMDPSEDRLNPNGGAIALGHPFGMSGARLVTTALNALESQDGQFALVTLCVGGGQGQAMVLERI